MTTNNFEIEINNSIEKVWNALTNSEEFNNWMKNVRVETNWKEGAEITYTCYDENGKVSQWEGMEMIWKGKIEIIKENAEFKCIYPNLSTGLVEESYLLEKLSDSKTKLKQIQTFTSEFIAEGYETGTTYTLELLKDYLNKR